MTDYHKTVDGIDVRGGIAPNDIPIEVRDKHYVHNQVQASSEWEVIHSLGKLPSIQIFDTEGINVMTYSEHVDNNKLVVKFNEPCCGSVVCN